MAKRFTWEGHQCSRFCKVHFYWNFEMDAHVALPTSYNILSSVHGWMVREVHVGPPAYYPKKPSFDQWADMIAVCPHDPPQLTCGHCRRHEFRALHL